jgi:hypothetical protein
MAPALSRHTTAQKRLALGTLNGQLYSRASIDPASSLVCTNNTPSEGSLTKMGDCGLLQVSLGYYLGVSECTAFVQTPIRFVRTRVEGLRQTANTLPRSAAVGLTILMSGTSQSGETSFDFRL